VSGVERISAGEGGSAIPRAPRARRTVVEGVRGGLRCAGGMPSARGPKRAAVDARVAGLGRGDSAEGIALRRGLVTGKGWELGDATVAASGDGSGLKGRVVRDLGRQVVRDLGRGGLVPLFGEYGLARGGRTPGIGDYGLKIRPIAMLD
jgi:hypothetical protein